jgi:DNA-binding LacI/PurR family transcriptional regulator/serine phosphatase RsbU (regulator of sigma subunit)
MPTSRQRKRIALAVNFLASAYQVTLRQAVERATRRYGYDLLVAIGRELQHVDPHERTLNTLYDWLGPDNVDGVIVLSGTIANFCGQAGVADLCRRLAPLPVLSVGFELPGVRSVVLDNRAAMRTAVEHVVQRHGARRVAYIGGPDHNQEAAQRLLGYRDVLEAHGLVADPQLVDQGHFSLWTGQEAMARLLGRTRDFDAVVVANDYMALGAVDELRARGIRVPEDVIVTGFDDAPIARFAARSLTTVAQPVDEIALCAVRELMQLMDGKGQPPPEGLSATLVLRDSCGCGYLVNGAPAAATHEAGSARDFLRANRGPLTERLATLGGGSPELCARFAPAVLSALIAELEGTVGAFLGALEQAVEQAFQERLSLDELARLLLQLRRECKGAGLSGSSHADLEEIVMKGLIVLSTAAARHEGRRALDIIDGAYGLSALNQVLAVALDAPGLAQNLERALCTLGLERCLFASGGATVSSPLVPLLVFEPGSSNRVSPAPYAPTQLFPAGFPSAAEPCCLHVWPLTFKTEVLGLFALDGAYDPFAGETLRSQLCASLKLGVLHGELMKETALRERLAHQQLLGEMSIAKRIQSALAPQAVRVPTLEIAAATRAADEVGGDYHDILPVPGGCWIGIGDVTGHGLLSGLIMLMLQSTVATLARVLPEAAPSQFVVQVNLGLRSNIRERLSASEHATLLLLRYFDDGRVTFAGAHEDLIVYRARAEKCELVASTGVWVGILHDVSQQTSDLSFRLEQDDLLVLYTDGVTEAANSLGHRFGIERLCSTIERCATLPVSEIHAALMRELDAWSPVQHDDVTCIVLRRVAAL